MKIQHDQLDPLYVIFEQHLCNFQDSDQDRKTFVGNVVKEYLTFLRKSNIAVPRALERSVCEEIESQVQVMLTKKIYGCLSIDEYRQKVDGEAKLRVERQYTRISAKR